MPAAAGPLNLTELTLGASTDLHSMRLVYSSLERFHSLLVLFIALVVPLMVLMVAVLVYKLHALRRRIIPAAERELATEDMLAFTDLPLIPLQKAAESDRI